MNFSAGSRFHGIELLRCCGGGAYGEVYYGEDLSGKRLAVKIISKEKLGSAWQRELKGVVNYRKITENAPELLQIYHVEEDDEVFFYTMEAADSATDDVYTPDTLGGRLQKGALPPGELFRTLWMIFVGIKRIHDAGFAHRDVKPDNILFVKGVPKLGDVGLLAALDTTLTQVAGTMDFLPPEVRTATGDDFSRDLLHPRNDLYAFGKVVYCAVTGNAPREWPTVPPQQKLSLPLKFFLRFSFRLCDKDPLKRLSDIDQAERELKKIERQLLYGETWRDKIAYAACRTAATLRSDFRHVGSWIVRHWCIVAFLLLAMIIGIFFFLKFYRAAKHPAVVPQSVVPTFAAPVIKPPPGPTKIYRNDRAKLTMTIPQSWEIYTHKSTKKLLDDAFANEKDWAPEKKRGMEMLREMLKIDGELIICQYKPDYVNSCFVQLFPLPGAEMWAMADDELRLEIMQGARGDLNWQTEIYELKHTHFGKYPCIYADLSHQRGIRTNNYSFVFDDCCVSIALHCADADYAECKPLFESVLSTLKFDESLPPLSENAKNAQ